jgi:hypothetical protein
VSQCSLRVSPVSSVSLCPCFPWDLQVSICTFPCFFCGLVFFVNYCEALSLVCVMPLCVPETVGPQPRFVGSLCPHSVAHLSPLSAQALPWLPSSLHVPNMCGPLGSWSREKKHPWGPQTPVLGCYTGPRIVPELKLPTPG